jgi:signal peptidase II
MLRWLWLSLAVIGLDQITKQWAEAALKPYQPLEFLPFFDLTLMYNKGAAFSFLSSQGGWQRWFFIVLAIGVTLVLVGWLRKLKSNEGVLAVALSLVIGGAVGNVIDRILFGHVIDFIDVYYQAGSCLPMFATVVTNEGAQCHWPAFNIADSAITLGVIVLLLDAFFSKREEA